MDKERGYESDWCCPKCNKRIYGDDHEGDYPECSDCRTTHNQPPASEGDTLDIDYSYQEGKRYRGVPIDKPTASEEEPFTPTDGVLVCDFHGGCRWMPNGHFRIGPHSGTAHPGLLIENHDKNCKGAVGIYRPDRPASESSSNCPKCDENYIGKPTASDAPSEGWEVVAWWCSLMQRAYEINQRHYDAVSTSPAGRFSCVPKEDHAPLILAHDEANVIEDFERIFTPPFTALDAAAILLRLRTHAKELRKLK